MYEKNIAEKKAQNKASAKTRFYVVLCIVAPIILFVWLASRPKDGEVIWTNPNYKEKDKKEESAPVYSSNSSTYIPPRNNDYSSVTSETDPFEVMHQVFEGEPSKDVLKLMIDDVIVKYNEPLTDDKRLKVGNMLHVLATSSHGKVSEMDILKDLYMGKKMDMEIGAAGGLVSGLLEMERSK